MQELHSRLPQATFVWKDLPEKGDIVPVYMRAHIAARCAQNFNKFWDYAALLFGSQSAMGTFDFTGQAATLGIPKKPFEECMNSPATRRAVEEGAQMARDRGISSTPFFYIDGTRVDGLQPINTFHKLITDAL